MILDAIPASVELLRPQRMAIRSRPLRSVVQARVDAITFRIEVLINPITARIQILLDAISAHIQPLLDPVAPIRSPRSSNRPPATLLKLKPLSAQTTHTP